MKVYNTLTQKIEEFVPLNNNEVKMYVCGITPYDEVHLGHARCYVAFDVIRRYLKYKGYKIHYVQNFTDVDDKIITRAKELNIHPKELTQRYITSYFEIEKLLNIQPASYYPKVTEHIDDIITAIEKLLNLNIAYITKTGVYYDVSKFHDYGKLSKRNINELISGVRVEPDETKKSPLDFALWKFSTDDVCWFSPWGKGRPGWHIECSVMSQKYLGETLDIHGGGQDLIFPHHENEIAQSEMLTGKTFVRYWLHNGFVTVNKEKMSKSLKNFFVLKEIFNEYEPMVVRLFLISQHYRGPIDFSLDKIKQFVAVYKKFVNTKEDIEYRICFAKDSVEPEQNVISEVEVILKEFESTMEEDFNTSKALSVIHKLINFVNTVRTNNKQTLMFFYEKYLLLMDILGIKLPEKIVIPQEILLLLNERETARKNKDFVTSDKLRKEIFDKGYIVEDTPFGPRIKKRI